VLPTLEEVVEDLVLVQLVEQEVQVEAEEDQVLLLLQLYQELQILEAAVVEEQLVLLVQLEQAVQES
tara:strand:+ start:487 stop:687 length:201 start_codon:yes stop_codon:yes gene_type:complete